MVHIDPSNPDMRLTEHSPCPLCGVGPVQVTPRDSDSTELTESVITSGGIPCSDCRHYVREHPVRDHCDATVVCSCDAFTESKTDVDLCESEGCGHSLLRHGAMTGVCLGLVPCECGGFGADRGDENYAIGSHKLTANLADLETVPQDFIGLVVQHTYTTGCSSADIALDIVWTPTVSVDSSFLSITARCLKHGFFGAELNDVELFNHLQIIN